MTSVSRIRSARKVILLLGDIAILFASLGASLALRQPQLPRLEVFQSFVPLFVLWIITFYAAGLYEFRLVRDFVSLIRGLLASSVVCAVLGASYFYARIPYLNLTQKTHLFLTVVIVHLGQVWD